MKRLTGFLPVILFLFLVSTGILWIYHDGLARKPGDGSFSLLTPLSAFPMPDGGFAIVDSDSERLVRFNAIGQLRWEIPPMTLFGRFLAVDAATDGMLYCIDEITQPGTAASGTTQLVQRLVRIGLDGSLAAVLLERRIVSGSGFVPGSLRVQDGKLWFLYDDGTATVLASLDIATLTEHISSRSDWVLDRASLAPGGPGGIVAVAAEGGLALFQRDRFETLSEHAPRLPYPACIRYDNNGRLYVADPVAGVILRLVPGMEPDVIVSSPATSDGSGSALVRNVAFDNFALGPEGLILVDRRTSSVLVVDPGKGGSTGQIRLVRELADFSVPDHDLKRSWLAWTLLAGSLITGLVLLVLLVLLVFNLAGSASRPVALFGASLPGLLGLAVVLVLAWYADESGRQTATEAAGLERLRMAAVAGAGALSGLQMHGSGAQPGASLGILAEVVAGSATAAIHPRASAGWENLRRRLASMVDQALHGTWPPISAVLYLESAGSFLYICDSDGIQVPGLVQGLAPAFFDFAVSLHRPMVGVVDSGGRSWLSAVAVVATPAGGPVLLLEMASPAYRPPLNVIQRLLARYVPEPDRGGLLFFFILALLAFAGLPLLVSGSRESAELMEYRIKLSSMDDKRRAVEALKSGKADEARNILEKVVDQIPMDPQALNNLGTAYARLGRFDDALRCFDAVVRVQADNASARANLTRLKEWLAKQPSSSKPDRR